MSKEEQAIALYQTGAASLEGEVVRRGVSGPVLGELGEALLLAPQLLKSSQLEPLVGDAEGMVAGEVDEETHLIVVADPDLLSNHGLARGSNAQVALALLERLRGGAGPVVFDERFGPLAEEPGAFRALLSWPLALFSLQLLLLTLGLLWAGVTRFGVPLRAQARHPTGAVALVESAAALQRQSGRSAHALASFLRSTAREVAERLHAPASLQGAALARFLDPLCAARKSGATLSELIAQVAQAQGASRQLEAARHIHQWKQEMLDGTR